MATFAACSVAAEPKPHRGWQDTISNNRLSASGSDGPSSPFSSPSSTQRNSSAIPSASRQTYEQHLADSHRRALQHSNSHRATSALTPDEMLAAQHHFGFSPSQQPGQGGPQSQMQTQQPDGAGWHDEQEQFLRELLSTPLDASPQSYTSGSHASQSPPYLHHAGGSVSGDDHARYSSLSPGSSSGLQSLHEFIHGNGPSAKSSVSGAAGVSASFPTPPDIDAQARPVQIKEEYGLAHPFGVPAPNLSAMDAGAMDFFLKSMTSQHASPPLHAMPAHLLPSQFTSGMQPGMQPGMDVNMLHAHYQQQQPHESFAPQGQQFHFQQPHSTPFPSTYEHPQQQHLQQHPIDSRKRSAPTPISTAAPSLTDAKPLTGAKRPRKSSAEKANAAAPQKAAPSTQASEADAEQPFAMGTSSFMPRMEVGSNATAMAAIERLKAKKRAAAEQEIKQKALQNEAISKGKATGVFGQSIPGAGVTPSMKYEKKVAHNAIERRYRNNINARISALRNAVPALRELRPKRPTRKGKEAPPEDLVDGVPAATKLNKATILGKATEYIRYLKGRETRLVSEVAGLRELIRSLEGGEELLDLWQGEMERVVAEQEAIAKAAFALEDESFDMDDDEDDEDEDEAEQKPSSRSPSNASSSSSRYMMGLFMGFSVLGGGAEVFSSNESATSSSASTAEHAHHVLRASSGRVLGASHQLLKRGMQATSVTVGNMAHEPHHFDHVANHLLIVEVLRGAALLACLAFIFWPFIVRFLPASLGPSTLYDGKRAPRSSRRVQQEDESGLALRRKDMLTTLANPASTPFQTDRAMRQFVSAPQSAVSGALSLATLSLRELAYATGFFVRVRRSHEEERCAIWCRLLELETSLGPLAQRSLIARLHTLLTVSCLPSVGYGAMSTTTATDMPLLHPARIFGTLAVAMVRASSGNGLVSMLFAERYWTMARRCRLLASDEGVSEDSVTEVSDRWLDPVLDMSLSDAIALCPPPVSVASTFVPHADAATRATMVSPLLSIAASQHRRQLSNVWTTLLCQIVHSTCPSSSVAVTSSASSHGDDVAAPTCADFVRHHAGAKIELALLSDTTDRDRMTGQITRLTLTAPRCPRSQIISNVTFGTWALLLGNMPVARSVAVALVRATAQRDGSAVVPACATAFVSLVLGEEDAERLTANGSSSNKGAAAALGEVDALASASLSWLKFLRTLSKHMNDDSTSGEAKTDVSAIAQHALAIRRMLAAARAVRPIASEEMLAELAAATLSAEQGERRSHELAMSTHRDSLASTSSSSAPSIAATDEGTARAAATSLPTGATTPLSRTSSFSRIAQQNLDDALDVLTDILSALGRKAATGGPFTKETLLQDDDNGDSGVEWTV